MIINSKFKIKDSLIIYWGLMRWTKYERKIRDQRIGKQRWQWIMMVQASEIYHCRSGFQNVWRQKEGEKEDVQ